MTWMKICVPHTISWTSRLRLKNGSFCKWVWFIPNPTVTGNLTIQLVIWSWSDMNVCKHPHWFHISYDISMKSRIWCNHHLSDWSPFLANFHLRFEFGSSSHYVPMLLDYWKSTHWKSCFAACHGVWKASVIPPLKRPKFNGTHESSEFNLEWKDQPIEIRNLKCPDLPYRIWEAHTTKQNRHHQSPGKKNMISYIDNQL